MNRRLGLIFAIAACMRGLLLSSHAQQPSSPKTDTEKSH